MKTKAKGSRIQRKAMIYYESQGYQTDIIERTSRFIKVKDNWGLFDFEALKGNVIIKVQVTCNKPHSHKKMLQWAINHASEHVWVEQMVWYDYKGFKRFMYYP